MPFAQGLGHFQTIRVECFRDRQASLEAFKKGDVTYREEFTTRAWASEYNFPAIEDGRVKRDTFAEEKWPNFQCWALKTSAARAVFRRAGAPRDQPLLRLRVDQRQPLFGLRLHSQSPFELSDYVATGAPLARGTAVLEPLRADLPPEVFGEVWTQPVTDASDATGAR